MPPFSASKSKFVRSTCVKSPFALRRTGLALLILPPSARRLCQPHL
jgi:hypothetical protein